jgi:hypothetical protein
MASLAVVKYLEVLKHRVGELNASAPSFPVEELDLHPTPKASITALSKQSPTEPIDGRSPESTARRVNAQEVN